MAANTHVERRAGDAGPYFSGHPFDPYRKQVKELVGCDLNTSALEEFWVPNNVATVKSVLGSQR